MKIKNTALMLVCVTLPIIQTLAGSFRVLGLSQVQGLERLEIVTPAGVKTVGVSISSVSQAFEIPESGELNFYRKAPKADETPEPAFTVNFNQASSNIILLLRPDDTIAEPAYKYSLIEDSEQAFSSGSVMLLNLSPKKIAAKLGDDRIIVATGEKTVVDLIKADKPFNGGVMFAAEFNGFGKVFSTSSWYLVPSMKILCIVYSDKRGNPQIRRIRLT